MALLLVHMILICLSIDPRLVFSSYYYMLMTWLLQVMIFHYASTSVILRQLFDVKDLGSFNYFLGLEVSSHLDGYYHSQAKYAPSSCLGLD